VVTDAKGNATLPIPASSEVAVSFDATAADHTKLLFLMTTGTADPAPLGAAITSTVTATSIGTAAGFNDAKGGRIIVQPVTKALNGSGSSPSEGVIMALSPIAGKGPVYFSGPTAPDPTLAASVAAGFGFGLFGDVPPGDYEMELTGKTCVATPLAWKGTAPNRLRVIAVADYLTAMVTECSL
jgi:hypothetical protein